MKNFVRLILSITSLVFVRVSFAQTNVDSSRFEIDGRAVVRSMQTSNKGDLANFGVTVAYADVSLSYKVTPWLKLNGQGNGLFNFGLDNLIKVDPTTLSGPIYEGNLWNPAWMSGSSHFALPVLNAELSFKQHNLTLGRFLLNSSIINPEPWPFPNAQEGIKYDYENESVHFQVALIDQFASRFDGRFHDVGGSFGRGANGFRVDGGPSRYLNNTSSAYMIATGIDWKVNDQMGLSFWNVYTENVVNTFTIEPKYNFNNGWTASALFIQQFKVNNGGNDNPDLTYFPDDKASYFGLRINKQFNEHLFQLNYSRITDQGRLQLTRDWGLEPIYTFQRRTRIEGHRDAHVIMLKWQKSFAAPHGNYRVFSSIARSWLPFPGNASASKYRQPSNTNIDLSLKYSPKGKLNGLAAEVFLLYRFLGEDLGGDDRYLINRADIFHSDIILSYTF